MSSFDNVELQPRVGAAELESQAGNGSTGKADYGFTCATAVTEDTRAGNDAVQEKWNYPRRNIYKTGAAFWGMSSSGRGVGRTHSNRHAAFIVMGANDGK